MPIALTPKRVQRAQMRGNHKIMTTMSKTENRLTVSQKGRHCGEIRFTFGVGTLTEIDDAMQDRAERELRADPQHQSSYYDMLLVTASGAELDFATAIV